MRYRIAQSAVVLLLSLFPIVVAESNLTFIPDELMAEPPKVKTRGQVGLDVEKYPVAPEGLELEQVHVYVRHGEWTNVSSL